MPTPIRTGSTSSSEIEIASSPSETDQFLPISANVITPSLLLPQAQEDGHNLGTFTAVNIILGKTIGVGVYSVPSSIFSDVGSVGMTIVLWALGSFISFCGLAVYLDLGSAIPRSGGERVYLERIFRRPHMLATCMFMAYVVLLGFSTPNCIVLGEYAIYALGLTPTTWLIRSIAVFTITLACVMHAKFPRLGVYTINVLGVAKMIILAFVVFSGIAATLITRPTTTDPADRGELQTIAQRNFSDLWAGSSSSPYDYSTALLKILYCFRGYNTANSVLSSVRNPIPTLKIAAPLALSIVSLSYLLANIAYFCAVEKDDFREAGVVLAGRFLSNLFGETVGERVLPWLVIVSAFGNVAATSFAQARVNQELGRDGLLPFSDFWAGKSSKISFNVISPAEPSEKPRHHIRPYFSKNQRHIDSLAPALFLHFLISALVILLPPPGQIYTFLIEIGGYPVSVISVAVSGGLLYLQSSPREKWKSPIPAPKICTIIFFVTNLFVLILPWIDPGNTEDNSAASSRTANTNDATATRKFVYYAYPATGLGILISGAYYWVWWRYLRPLVFPPKKSMMGFGNGWSDGTDSANESLLNRRVSASTRGPLDMAACERHSQGPSGTTGLSTDARFVISEELEEDNGDSSNAQQEERGQKRRLLPASSSSSISPITLHQMISSHSTKL